MKLTRYATGIMLLLSSSFIANAQWSLTGNASTNPSSNFLGTTDAQSVVFKTNNTEIFRLFATDNTLSMSAPIRMNNNAIYFGSTAADPYYYIQNIGWDQGMKYIHYTSHQFFTNSGEKMRIQQNGNVGIGTSSPAYKLDVAGDARISGKSYYKAEYSVGVGAYVAINLNAAGNTMGWRGW
jgi:hypothetical protein